MSAEYYDVTEQRQTVGHGLVERLAIGRSKNHLIVVPLLFQSGNTGINGLDLHNHTGLAAERIVIHLAVAAGGIVAQIVDHNLHKALVAGPFQDRAVDEGPEHLGHYCQQVYPHPDQSISSSAS